MIQLTARTQIQQPFVCTNSQVQRSQILLSALKENINRADNITDMG